MSAAAPTRTPPATEQLGRSFKAALAAVRRLQGHEAHRHGTGELSHAQYGLLFTLREREPQPLGELACAASLSPAAASEMIDGLVAAGLVRRGRSERDRRVALISLTARGHELIERRRAAYEPRWRAALRDFTDDELLTAAAVLDRLRLYFDELRDA